MGDYPIKRRTFLQGAGFMAAAATGAFDIRTSRAEQVPFSAGTEAPKLKLPADSCDCHMHIYDARYPAAPSATLLPPDASVDDYRLLQKRLGSTRNVVVQPSTYGTDNRCTLDAMAKIGPTARGVAVVDTTVSDDELKRLDSLGVRGIRFNLVQAGATTVDMLEPLSKRVSDLGWHVQIHALGDQIVQIGDTLQRLPSPIVFDHLGRIPHPAGAEHPAFTVISKLIDKGQTWVKLSGAYMDTKSGPAAYEDTGRLAQAYVRKAPERMLWATDWPHPTMKDKPDDAILVDLLPEWAPAEATRRRILVDNPAIVYNFPKT
jgi:predicted TIM-barrel fold metal-dependent hydrolase